MAVVVRRATAADAPALAAVASATFALACPPHTTQESIAAFIADVLSQERFQEYLADPERDLFLAEDGAVATGYAMLVTGEPGDPDVRGALAHRPSSELSKIYVLPDQHGAGTSRLLMTAALDAARARGSRGAWLGVNQLNERAQRFYAKSGFTRVGTKRFLVGDRYEDDYVFEQAL
ncbi:GNAT family N-acetyltransferase [Pedococcus aerophilus]|uniref:GNAT family N-acetyltransferase n=1 Tax=Pedococcus aerophilus TaxID=436356 RepID=A0ABN3UDM4_9MICO